MGMSVQVMPCSAAHAFHPPCLKPWLAAHNSCPICRHEVPTDDERARPSPVPPPLLRCTRQGLPGAPCEPAAPGGVCSLGRRAPLQLSSACGAHSTFVVTCTELGRIVRWQLLKRAMGCGAGYERRKVRDAQEAEDRKGAANAVTHLDFLYT